MRKQSSILIFLVIAAMLSATWFYVLHSTPPQQTLDQRVHDVASQLKCLVCQGESVADSPATLSQQMRGIIRQQLQSGKSEQEVIQYFVSRYGDRILLSPPWQGLALLAWLVPIALLLSGTLLLFFILRSWHAQSSRGSLASDALESEAMNEREMEYYQHQVEQELAAEDPVLLDKHLTNDADASEDRQLANEAAPLRSASGKLQGVRSAQARCNEVISRLGTEDD